MCQEGGRKAIACLNGYHSHQITKPLLVELSHEVGVEVGFVLVHSIVVQPRSVSRAGFNPAS